MFCFGSEIINIIYERNLLTIDILFSHVIGDPSYLIQRKEIRKITTISEKVIQFINFFFRLGIYFVKLLNNFINWSMN